MTLTLTAKFAEIARDDPERVSMIVQEEHRVQEYTYAQIYHTALHIANWFAQKGVQKEDRVALAVENRSEWGMTYLGILFAGAIAVPTDTEIGFKELYHILGETQPKIFFTTEKRLLQELQERRFPDKIVLIGHRELSPELRKKTISFFSELVHSSPADTLLPPVKPENIASILYTSGTTGPAKGVMLTHQNFCANFLSLSKLKRVSSPDNFLSLLPLHHSFPFMGTLLLPLLSGAQITYVKTLRAEAILKCIREKRVTILPITPRVLEHFYHRIAQRLNNMPLGLGVVIHALLTFSGRLSGFIGINPVRPFLSRFRSVLGSQFRYFICGGAKLNEKVARNFIHLGFVVLEGYGLTETAPVVSLNPPENPKIGSAGKALPDVGITIHAPDEQGIGQILVKGANVMKGYYKNEQATQEAIHDGWFYTGDLGYIDHEGYLFLRGRIKDIIVLSSGKNVFAEEVEQHYLQAPSIKEICVLPGSDEEKLVAVIVIDSQYLRETGKTDIHGTVKWDMDSLAEEVAPHQRIRDFVLLNEDLPKTRLGKIKRHEAKRIYEEKLTQSTLDEQPVTPEDISEMGKKCSPS